MRCPDCHRRIADGTACPVHPDLYAPPPPPESQALPVVDGYADLRPLGGGGFAQVFSARRDTDGLVVALKVSLSRGDERYAREASALRHLKPPISPTFYGEGITAEQLPYLAMERVSGQLLSDWLIDHNKQAPPPEQLLAVLRAVGEALDGMHRAGVLHRDLKPENIFLREDGTATLIDFGLARSLGEKVDIERETAGLTATGQRPGTPAYMSPEQCAAAGDLDERTDLYAFGVIIFECLTTRPPFVGNPAIVEQAQVARRPPNVSELVDFGPDVDQVVGRYLAKERSIRHGSAKEMIDALEKALAARTERRSETAEGAAKPRAKASSRRPAALLAVRWRAPTMRVATTIDPEGGKVIRTKGDLHVIAFPNAPTAAAGIRAAMRSADRLASVCQYCVIHVAEVRIRTAKDRVTVLGQAVDRANQWAIPTGPTETISGPLLTPEAAAVVGQEMAKRVADTGFFTLKLHAPLFHERNPNELPLVGREESIEALLGDARECVDTKVPTLTTLVAEVGYGKSRLLSALADRLSGGDLEVARLSAPHPESHGASELKSELLRYALGLPPEQVAAEEIHEACLDRLGAEGGEAAWPSVALTLGALADGDAAAAEVLRAPGAVRMAVARAIADSLVELAREQPLALLVDDAQWADPIALDALELATMSEQDAPLWICVATEPQLSENRPAWADRARKSTRHTLKELDEESARDLFRALLEPVEYVPENILAQLTEATGRVPLYAVDTAHALRVGGAIKPLRGTESWAISAEDLREVAATPMAERLARRTLESLPPGLLGLARLCAVLGEPLELREVDAIQRLAGTVAGDVDASVGLQQLVRVGVLRAERKTSFRFRHPMLREAIETLCPDSVTRELHDAGRRFLEQLSDRSPARLARLAQHAAACGERGQAGAAYLELAHASRDGHSYLEAEQLYSAALEQLDEDRVSEREQALAGRGRMRYRLWKIGEARDDVEAALQLAEARNDNAAVVDLLLEKATILDWAYQIPETAELVRRAREHATDLTDPALRARLAFAIGRSQFRQEHHSEAIETLAEAARTARGLGEYETEALSLLIMAPALAEADRLDEAEKCYAEVIELCASAGDQLHLGGAYTNRTILWMKRRDYTRALADSQRAVDVARELGHVQLERVVSYNLAELLGWLGRLDDALPPVQRACDLERFCDTAQPEIPLLRARIHCARREVSEAATVLQWLDSNISEEQYVPTQRVLRDMVRLSCRENSSAEAWGALLADAREHSQIDERLEILHEGATTAKRAGWTDSLSSWLAEARELASTAPTWLRRFDAIQ